MPTEEEIRRYPFQIMNKLILLLIRKTLEIDLERLISDNDALLVKSQQLSFRVKDTEKEIAYYRRLVAQLRKELSQAKENARQTQQEKEAIARSLLVAEHETQNVLETLATRPAPDIPQTETDIEAEPVAPEPQPEEKEPKCPTPTTGQPPEILFGDEPAETPTIEPQEEIPTDPEQRVKLQLKEQASQYPYIQITRTTAPGKPLFFPSESVGLKVELFTWGIEGQELMSDENVFIPYDETGDIKGIASPYIASTAEAEEIPNALLTAMKDRHPIRISYKDRNGRTAERTLSHICYASSGNSRTLDEGHIMGRSPHAGESRAFAVSNIQTVHTFGCVTPASELTEALLRNMRQALFTQRPEITIALSVALSDDTKKTPSVKELTGHALIMTGHNQEALKTYISVNKDADVGNGKTWKTAISSDLDEFIRLGIHRDVFSQLKEALCEDYWGLE